jgi:CarD family transcriptional regulator
MAQTKKAAPSARPAKPAKAKASSKKPSDATKAPAKKPARAPEKAEATKKATKAAPASKAQAAKPTKESAKSAPSAKEAPKVVPSSRDLKAKPSARDVSAAASSKDVAKAAASSKDVAKAAASSKDVAKAAASSKDVAKAAASSKDVSKAAASSKDVSKAAKVPPAPQPKYTEPDLGTYRTRPPPPLPRIASQPPPAPSPPPVRPPMPPAKGYQPIVNIQPFPRSTEPLNLSVGDKAVHPLHGLGEVSSIEHREVGGVSGDFYILRILDKGMRVMVPKASATSSGLRAVMSEKDANAVLDTLRAKEVAVDLQPWSRRFRAYTEMMKSGSPHEVAKVLRDMFRLKFDKDLSFGERRLLDQAKSLLMKELAAAKKISEADLLAEVSEMFKA